VFVTFNVPSNCSPPSDLITFSAKAVGPTGCYSSVQCQMTLTCDVATAALVSRFDAKLVAGAWTSPGGPKRSARWTDGMSTARRSEADGWVRLNTSPIAMSSGGEFLLHDGDALPGDAVYRLSAILTGGSEEVQTSTRISAGGDKFSFSIAGRNPFAGTTMLRYSLPRAERVRVDVYTVAGQHVRTLVDRMEPPCAYGGVRDARRWQQLRPGSTWPGSRQGRIG